MALGMCPRDKLFRGYIDLEIQLREFDRCRILYEKFLEFGTENCTTWMKVLLLNFLFDTAVNYSIYVDMLFVLVCRARNSFGRH